MNHLIVAPIILPALVAPLIIMVLRYHIDLQRIFSVASVALMLAISVALGFQAADGTVQVYELGNWPAPFGIVLVLDQLSAMMIVLTTVLAMAVVLYAIGTGWDERGANFHALFQFQLMGILGAFMTGDAFNLFVFFEVLLIASYGLMIHSGGAQRFRAGVQYVAYNLLGSTLFLFALGVLYATTGTLNMADIAVRVAALPETDTALLRVGALMLLLVFAIKAAVLPLHFWLPASYSNAPLPVAALFAIMTKVGAYAILRVYTLAFGPDVPATAGLAGDWLLPAAIITLVVGAIGVLGSREIGRLIAFAAIASMGTLLISIALFTPASAAAALYYILHSTLATALMFLIADQVMERQGGAIKALPPMAQSGLLSVMFFIGAIALAGMPPLSGFIGKLLILDAARSHDLVWWIWAAVLVGSLITIIGLARAGTLLFWKSHGLPDAETDAEAAQSTVEDNATSGDDASMTTTHNNGSPLPITVCMTLAAIIAAMTIFAGPITRYTEATAQHLFAPSAYIETVLKGDTE
ncbi:monovalent cation/H+ antiporter subunit D [Phaeobacter sp.]|uniref:monovalent cation/H+ antiporter subunit D n=1 Tax=Phaeobacter sp. TaxID=1902409 RepID=UPI0025D2C6B9|nr:monovalent cation/H+ antiporter subunit D [Phaeobacter sp.]